MAALAAVALPVGAQAQVFTSFTVLPTLGADTWAFDVNNSREVVGFSRLTGSADNRRAFRYTTTGGIENLGLLPPGGIESYAYAINDSGQITGDSWVDGSTRHAYRYENGSMTDFGPTDYRAFAYGINESGTIVGRYNTTSGAALQAFVNDGTTRTNLHSVVGGSFANSVAYDINSDGQIVGTAYAGSLTDGAGIILDGQAFRYTPSTNTVINLGLGGANSVAYGINDLGQVVGTAADGSGNFHAFLHTDGESTVDLGVLGTGTRSIAFGINHWGDVVGYSMTAGLNLPRAFLYQDGALLDLNNLGLDLDGWTLLNARAINDHGDIVGVAFKSGIGDRAFLLTAVPEPSTYAMLLGAVTLLVVIWRRVRSRHV